MYTTTQISNNNLSNYIDGTDIYNSKLLYLLSELDDTLKEYFTITTLTYRPDLIAKDFYGDSSYQDYVMILLKCKVTNLVPGKIIKLLPKKILDSIISNGKK